MSALVANCNLNVIMRTCDRYVRKKVMGGALPVGTLEGDLRHNCLGRKLRLMQIGFRPLEGRSVASEQVERRIATILAAGMADHSQLMVADEGGTGARAKSLCRDLFTPKVREYRGRIVGKTIRGGALVEFARVEDAVRCALDVQQAAADRNADLSGDRRILLRMGISFGDVLVGTEGDLQGDGVDLAVSLEDAAEPGGICLSRSAYAQSKDSVAAEFDNLGEQRLKDLARPVRVYAIRPPTMNAPPTPLPVYAPSSPAVPRLSVVVMPFANLCGDSEQDYFVDGVTESLTTDLSRIPDAFVIGRNTAFSYKDKAIDARTIGRELGVRYVMEGSVQCGADRIRVSAQLLDAESGAHLWAERFDKPSGDLFDMQDEITTRLARMVGIELVAAEGRRAARERPESPDATDLAMRGRAAWNQPLTLNRVREARALFEAAIALDDRNVVAHLGVADAHIEEVVIFASDNRAEQIAAAERAISKAMVLAPDSAAVHFSRGILLFAMCLPELALREHELAIGLDRNFAKAHVNIGLMKLCLGRARETEAHVAQAIRLSPRDPYLSQWLFVIGLADLYLGKNVRAVTYLRQSVQLNPNWHLSNFVLAGALALAGLLAEAAAACAVARRLGPTFTVRKFRAEAVGDNAVYLAQRERLCEGLLMAGVPEEIAVSKTPEAVASAPPGRPSPAPPSPEVPSPQPPSSEGLAYPDFVAALKNALRDFSRPDLLAGNPLLRTRLFATHDKAGPGDLRALLFETVNALFAGARDEKLRRAIEFTYFRPGPKQAATAERLGLAFGTYRRHLATALDRLARWLWDRERRERQ
ncbi:MAG: adenylate/guanylate cyclase domain-containing protein [Alphaproteobacteria bacterium]|nr:adenylate/guanylate cyclase domain-containing protein [Alphaproteobacteria bacterium]